MPQGMKKTATSNPVDYVVVKVMKVMFDCGYIKVLYNILPTLLINAKT